MKRLLTRRTNWFVATALIAIGVLLCSTIPSAAAGAGKAAGAIWANDQLYDVVLTPAFFKNAPIGSTDALYNFGESGLAGQRSVSEAAPGDPEYNGGRWRVMAVAFTELGMMVLDSDADGAIDVEITNSDLVLAYADEGYLEIADSGVRFECPLLPRRNPR